jgi:hypothetical protein
MLRIRFIVGRMVCFTCKRRRHAEMFRRRVGHSIISEEIANSRESNGLSGLLGAEAAQPLQSRFLAKPGPLPFAYRRVLRWALSMPIQGHFAPQQLERLL